MTFDSTPRFAHGLGWTAPFISTSTIFDLLVVALAEKDLAADNKVLTHIVGLRGECIERVHQTQPSPEVAKRRCYLRSNRHRHTEQRDPP